MQATVYKTYGTPNVIFDAVGKGSFTKNKNSLTLKGTILTVAMNLVLMFRGPLRDDTN